MIQFVVAHVTILLIVAFFIFFAASKAEGLVALLGNILGVWVVIVAVLHAAACFVPGLAGMKGVDMMHDGMHGHWMHHWGMEENAAPATAPAATPAPPAPAKPAPAQPAPVKKH